MKTGSKRNQAERAMAEGSDREVKKLDICLQDFYQQIQISPFVRTCLPDEVGRGEITRTSTKNGYQASSWKLVYDRDTDVQGTVSEGFRLLFCMGEGVEWKSEGKRMQLDKGEACFCLDQGQAEMMRYDAGSRYSFDSFTISLSILEGMISNYVQNPKETIRTLNTRHFSVTPEIRRKLQEISFLQMETTMFGMLRIEAGLQELMWTCMDAAANINCKRNRIHQDDADVVRRIKAGIDAEPAKAAKIDVLAKDYGISTAKLSRCFKETYGMPLHAYLIEARLCEGARLLSEEKLMIGEVAERVGYAKQSQFAAAFRKRFGVSPKDY